MRPVSVVRIVAEAARTAPLLGTVVSPLLNRGRDHRDGDVIATRVGHPPRTPFNRPIAALVIAAVGLYCPEYGHEPY